jgi:hypothetical protein
MQLVPYQNSSGINRNHQNNIPTVAMGIADVIMPMTNVISCCAFAGLVPPRSPNLELTYLKIELHKVVANINTRPRACMRVAVEACSGGSARVQAAVAVVIGEAVGAFK